MTVPIYSTGPAQTEGINSTVITLGSLGNPLLRPERVAEHEFGFDMDLLSRVRVSGTWYRRQTKDQIIRQELPPGLGSIYTNLGLTTGRGFEGELGASIVRDRNIMWDVEVRHSKHTTMLVDAGGAFEDFGPHGGYREGYPLGARFTRKLIGYHDANENGAITLGELHFADTLSYAGQSTPSEAQMFTSTLGLLNRRVRLSALFERRAGYTERVWTPCPFCIQLIDPATPLDEQAEAVAAMLSESAKMEAGDHVRWREASVSAELPSTLLRHVPVQGGTITVSARNIAIWTRGSGKLQGDVVSGLYSGLRTVQDRTLPESTSWTIRLDVGF